MEEQFNPKGWTRNPHLQSILASLKIRTIGPNPMTAVSKAVVIDGGDGVRLQGYLSEHPDRDGRPLILLLHGWEGHSGSAYMLHTGRYFYQKGYDIFRLNFRDHGDTHSLNPGLFHGALIDEVVTAVHRISILSRGNPFYIIGFSLGGNYALRIALRQGDTPIDGLEQVVAVSPPIDPFNSTLAVDKGLFIYRSYFLMKWKRSLRKKQAAFPDLYDFRKELRMSSILEITESIIRRYSDFGGHRDYFDRYTLTKAPFASVTVPVTVIIAEDDPVIPVEDLRRLGNSSRLKVSIQPHGGHCGFIDPFPCGCWYERRIEALYRGGRP